MTFPETIVGFSGWYANTGAANQLNRSGSMAQKLKQPPETSELMYRLGSVQKLSEQARKESTWLAPSKSIEDSRKSRC